MDDWLTGADSDAEGCDMIQEADVIMKTAGMSLSKWSSSSPVVAEMLHHQFQDKYLPADSVFHDRCHFEVGVMGVVAEAVWVEGLGGRAKKMRQWYNSCERPAWNRHR